MPSQSDVVDIVKVLQGFMSLLAAWQAIALSMASLSKLLPSDVDYFRKRDVGCQLDRCHCKLCTWIADFPFEVDSMVQLLFEDVFDLLNELMPISLLECIVPTCGRRRLYSLYCV